MQCKNSKERAVFVTFSCLDDTMDASFQPVVSP